MAPDQRLQEFVYQRGHDYRDGAPHLLHHHLNDMLRSLLRDALDDVRDRGLPLDLLDIGAGDGAFVEPALAYGASVTATEMSRHSIDRMRECYGANASFQARADPDGSLAVLGDARYAAILYGSVLHHIPDYLEAIRTAVGSHLRAGGSLVTLQDPLWYPTLPRGVKLLTDLAFLSWRVGQGNLARGMRTRLRRLRGVYDDDNPADVIEYHWVRQGVDQDAIRALLRPRFERVEILAYWSTPAGPLQRAGDRSPLANTFAVRALGYDGGLLEVGAPGS